MEKVPGSGRTAFAPGETFSRRMEKLEIKETPNLWKRVGKEIELRATGGESMAEEDKRKRQKKFVIIQDLQRASQKRRITNRHASPRR